jgi:RHS repeat-associated protein
MITNSSGGQMARLSSDAWGRRRNGGTWSGVPAASEKTTITNTTRHGFTSHEMLDNLYLVHMNGRVYDQIIGRFMSADPFIDGAGSTQGWNRYAYVQNSPLRFTDPSGFQAKSHVARINGIEIENVVVEGSRGGGAGLATLVAGLQGNITRGAGGGERGGGGSAPALNVIEEVVTTASRIWGAALSALNIAANSTQPENRTDYCALAAELDKEDVLASPTADGSADMIDSVDNAATIFAGAANAAAASTQGDAFIRMTSAADDLSALPGVRIPTMAEQFGPLARGLGWVGLGINAGQIVVGASRDGWRGATYAGIDAAVTNVSARLGPVGIGYALAYNMQGGSQAIDAEHTRLGRIERMNSVGALCNAQQGFFGN